MPLTFYGDYLGTTHHTFYEHVHLKQIQLHVLSSVPIGIRVLLPNRACAIVRTPTGISIVSAAHIGYQFACGCAQDRN